MAPTRRKGGGRTSAAAAASASSRRHWKVGDLVLAKVKGFPAWPATVSKPEKWGYSADWKKVLVYFFGTQQIAFCNPADVEEFTEEKKESLLVKRHGKGADFVRAVREIIESYEKLKKQDEIVDISSVDKVTVTNAVNSAGNFALKDEIEASSAILNPCVKKSCSTGDKNESSLPVGDAADATQVDFLLDRETSSEEPIDSLVARKRLENTFSLKKRLGGVQPQSSALQKRGPSACRSRRSSRADFMLPSSHGSKAAGDVDAKVLQDAAVRRSKRIRKIPDTSEVHDRGSPAFHSNGSIEENGSETVTVDSDTFSLTEGSNVDVESGCKLLRPEYVVEYCEGDVEFSQRIDFQIKAIVTKKKRKANRKRVTNDVPETTDRLNSETGSEVEVHRAGKISPIFQEKLNGRYSKEDGDEHLPLVKRARVRMGRPSSAGEELDTFTQSEVKLLKVSNSFSGQVSTALSCEEDGSADRNSFIVKGATENSSLQNKCPQSSVDKPQPWEVKKIQQFVCSVDGEAALPPSKRLNRALEAMSANAGEHGETVASSTMKTLINGCCFSSIRESPHSSMGSRAGNGFGVLNVDILSSSASQDDTSSFSMSSVPAVPKVIAKSSLEVATCNGPVRSSSSPELKLCKDVHVEAVDHSDFRSLSCTSSGTQTTEAVVVAHNPKPPLPDPRKELACLGCNQGLLAQMLPFKDEFRSENPELSDHKAESPPLNELDPSERSGMSSDPLSGAVDGKGSPQNDTNLLLCSTECNHSDLSEHSGMSSEAFSGAVDRKSSPQNDSNLHLCATVGNHSGTTKSWKLPLHANNQVDKMCEVVKEIKPIHRDNGILTPTSVKVMAAAAEGPPNLFRSTSISDDHSGDKDVSGIRSSSSPTDGLETFERTSPPNTSICNISSSGNDNILEENSCCSPDVHLHPVTSKIVSKWSNKAEATAALASFQAILGTLTRTKDSIGRATRIAIDCAKFGIAAKVVEILARNLESESSLHRRVDLFFLVDSIVQCSRGLKGDVGDIYPSTIQAVLPRLMLAAAPPGTNAQENHRQCLKVLRLWLERRILPDSVIRHCIRDLESLSVSSSFGAFSRRPFRTERAFDDPIREMEGMLVDEYGSNSSFQLPGFCMPPLLKDEDEGNDSDGGSFEAVTPEHNSETPGEQERIPIPATIEKHRHILEDVDGELEMEDVAPTCEADMSSSCNAGINTAQTMLPQFEQHFPLSFAPPLPKDVPPSSPPLPTSPPPPPPPPPPALPPPPMPDSKLYNIKENLHQSVVQQPVGLRINSITSDAVFYLSTESRDVKMQAQMPDSASSGSFSSLPGSHPPIPPVVNSAHQIDGANFHKRAYHVWPPQPAPSNQFSYVQTDQRVQPLSSNLPPSYPNRPHFVQSTDGGNFYTDHNRMQLDPHELRESWRFSGPSFSGTCYPDHARGSYPPAPYSGPQCEPPLPNHNWGFHPRDMNHRELVPDRRPPPSIPVAIRAPSFWQPR